MTTSIFDLYGANETDAENGKWFDFGPEIKVKIRRFKSKKSRQVREALEAPYKRANKASVRIPDEQVDSITTQHIAEGIVVDWKGIVDREGNTISYSPAAARVLFEQLPEFRDAVAEVSLDLENFREEEKKDVEGN